MNRLQKQQNKQNANSYLPRQDLYIYYLNGRLQADKALFQDNFIGNWEEEDDSFLFFSSPAPRHGKEAIELLKISSKSSNLLLKLKSIYCIMMNQIISKSIHKKS